jgi:hypothetical protein
MGPTQIWNCDDQSKIKYFYFKFCKHKVCQVLQLIVVLKMWYHNTIINFFLHVKTYTQIRLQNCSPLSPPPHHELRQDSCSPWVHTQDGPPSRPVAFFLPPSNARGRETGYVESAAAGYVSSGKRWRGVIKWSDKRLYAICVETKNFRFLLQNRREFAGTWFVSHRFRSVFSRWSFDSQLSKYIISFEVRHNLWFLKPELKLVCFY